MREKRPGNLHQTIGGFLSLELAEIFRSTHVLLFREQHVREHPHRNEDERIPCVEQEACVLGNLEPEHSVSPDSSSESFLNN